MLSTYPQSIWQIYIDAFKGYKKLFLSLLPVSLFYIVIIQVIPFEVIKVFNITKDMVVSMVATNKGHLLLLSLISLIFVVVSSILSYGFIYFIYTNLIERPASYKASLFSAARKIFKILAVTLVVVFGFGLFVWIMLWSYRYKVVFYTLIPITVLTTSLLFLFQLVYSYEILIKNSNIFPALKITTKIILRVKSVWRILAFILAGLVFGIALVLLIAALIMPLSFIPSLKVGSEMFTNIFSWLYSMFLMPLYIIILINFYNDLVLRFEQHKL